MDYPPYEIIIEIIKYIIPIDIGLYNTIDIQYLCNLLKYPKVTRMCKNILNISLLNKHYHEVICNYGIRVIYFSGNINVNALLKYKPRYIIAPSDNTLTDSDLEKLANTTIKMLRLDSNRLISDAGLKHIPHIECMIFKYNNNITNTGLLYTPNLKRFVINMNNNVSNEGLLMLPQLELLELKRTGLQLLKFIIEERLVYLPNLTHISINGRFYINDDVLQNVPNLTHLELEHTTITDRGFKHIPKLLFLKIWNNVHKLSITDIGLSFVPCLKYLKICAVSEFTNIGMSYLHDLEYLYLVNELIYDKGLSYLPNLKKLTLLSNNNITDNGLNYVPDLEYIEMDNNQKITYNGLNLLPMLKYIYMKSNYDTPYDQFIYKEQYIDVIFTY